MSFEQGLDLGGSVGAHGQSGFHHDARIFHDFFFGIALQQTIGEVPHRGEADCEDKEEYEVKLHDQFHSYSLPEGVLALSVGAAGEFC